MPPKKRTREEMEAVERPVEHGQEDKKELAKRLLKGDGVEKDEAKAVSLLEDCVAFGDADAMVTLAECYAYGCGTEQDKDYAETLISQSAEKGNSEAKEMMKLIKEWKGEEAISLSGLFNKDEKSFALSRVILLNPK